MKMAAEKFQEIEKALKAKPWFKKEGWIARAHGFPAAKPEYVTFHVFKKHWWNDDTRGIHIESYLALDPKKAKTSYVTIHLLHHTKIPGTKLKRIALAKPFVDSIYDRVKTWPGYKFRAGKYGTQPFTFALDGTSKDFEAIVEAEVSRLCRKLGPSMERAIAATVGGATI